VRRRIHRNREGLGIGGGFGGRACIGGGMRNATRSVGAIGRKRKDVSMCYGYRFAHLW